MSGFDPTAFEARRRRIGGQQLAVLGTVVLIRTFLSFSLRSRSLDTGPAETQIHVDLIERWKLPANSDGTVGNWDSMQAQEIPRADRVHARVWEVSTISTLAEQL